MAIVSLNTIKNWFKTGLKPTQLQFWDTWDSFRHKQDAVPMADINGLDTALQNKADKSAFDAHLADDDAHSTLQKKAKVYQATDLQVFKREGNTALEIEAGDLVIGIIEGAFIRGIYVTGNEQELASYNIIDQIDF